MNERELVAEVHDPLPGLKADLIQAKHIIEAHQQNIRSLEQTIASKQAALDASSREIRSQKDKIAMLREMIHDAMVN